MIKKLQNWYQLNCNGTWEHNNGISIHTLDNPGWSISLNLAGTPLEELNFDQKKYNKSKNDWYDIKALNTILVIACGPKNLEEVLAIFFDKIVKHYADKNFNYQLYLPLGRTHEVWLPALARMVDEESLQITELPKADFSTIRFRDVNQINMEQSELDEVKISFQIGDIVKVRKEEVWHGVILTAIQ